MLVYRCFKIDNFDIEDEESCGMAEDEELKSEDEELEALVQQTRMMYTNMRMVFPEN